MTMPENLQQSVPGALTQAIESPALIRTGTVTQIVSADNITVRISGSPVLVTASYLFPTYLPLLGDRVYVIKQDAQWFVLGTMSGPINSVLANPSFELGTDFAIPTNWTVTTPVTTSGTPTFTKFPAADPLTGISVGLPDLTPIGTGFANLVAESELIPTVPDTLWTAALYVNVPDLNFDNSLFVSIRIRWYTPAAVVITTNTLGGQAYSASTAGWTYLRPDATDRFVTAPPNTGFVSLVLDFGMDVATASSPITAFVDYAILRNVTF